MDDDKTEPSEATSPGRTNPRSTIVWRSFPTVISRTASTTSTPLGKASTTRPARFSESVELNADCPLPLKFCVEVGENKFCQRLAAGTVPKKALTPEEALNVRAAAAEPLFVAEKLSTTRMTSKSPVCRAL